MGRTAEAAQGVGGAEVFVRVGLGGGPGQGEVAEELAMPVAARGVWMCVIFRLCWRLRFRGADWLLSVTRGDRRVTER